MVHISISFGSWVMQENDVLVPVCTNNVPEELREALGRVGSG